MAEKQQIKETVVKVLFCVENVSSFASSINPLFGIVTSVVGDIGKGLEDEEDHEMHNDFKQIHEKLEAISEKNKKVLQQIRMNEIKENYGKYEMTINYLYKNFNTMVEKVKQDPNNSKHHMQKFVELYRSEGSDRSLDVFYDGVMGTSLFGRSILKVYLENCNGDKKVMEAHCSHLAHLFYTGLMTLIAFKAITEDDEDELKDKWGKRFDKIQAEMQKVLNQ
ncbi:protein rapunzel-like [Chanodichthys erythropterus]|uniref:protein rapunzel-like n=1 Tax=Chanodichthys erythropterus TaxID=933992 RepID=UPI00351F46A0